MTTQIIFGLLRGGPVRMLRQQTVTSETVSPGTSNQQTIISAPASDLAGRQPMARIASSVDCRVTFGADPVAFSDTSIFVPAGRVEFVAVKTGDRAAYVLGNAKGMLAGATPFAITGTSATLTYSGA